MITCFFGLPGCGKTTVLTMLAVKEQRRIDRGLSPYKYVYTNVEVDYPGIRLIHWDVVGSYVLEDALILIDEATLYADSRRYKTFPKEKIEFFMTHRHDRCDLVYFAQFFDAVDKRMRMVTDRVFYVKKIRFTGLSILMRIPKSIIIPEQTGDIIEGYRMPKWFERLFMMRILIRRRWYRYFNSWTQYGTGRPQLVEGKTVFTRTGSPRRIDRLINRFIATPLHQISDKLFELRLFLRRKLSPSSHVT